MDAMSIIDCIWASLKKHKTRYLGFIIQKSDDDGHEQHKEFERIGHTDISVDKGMRKKVKLKTTVTKVQI